MKLALSAALFCFAALPAFADDTSCQGLHEAVFLDEPKDVSYQLDHGVNPECKDVLGHTPLITAINGASLASFKVLMKHKVSTKVKSEYGYSALDHAKWKYASIADADGFGTMRGIFRSMIDQLESIPN